MCRAWKCVVCTDVLHVLPSLAGPSCFLHPGAQSEVEDSEEEIKRLEDSLEALAILKDYTSPWPLGSDGKPATDGGMAPSASTTGGGGTEVIKQTA